MNVYFLFFKQKTAYEMRISYWCSDVCSSDLPGMTGSNLAGLAAAMPLVVQGEDDDSSGITCISDVLANNDSLTIRRVNSCEQCSANCADVAGAPYFQASDWKSVVLGKSWSVSVDLGGCRIFKKKRSKS